MPKRRCQSYAWLALLGMLTGCASIDMPRATQPPAPMPADIGWSQARIEPPEENEPARLPVPSRPATAHELVVPYKDGEATRADIAPGVPLTLQLRPDEQIITIVGGDRSILPEGDKENPWMARIGAPGTPSPLVHVTVTRPGISTSLTIPTTKRLYLVDLRSVPKTRVRVVRWTYPHEPLPVVAKKPSRLPDPTLPQRYHVGYTIEPTEPRPVWTPRQVVDTGQKTFILFPPNLAAMESPLIRLVGPTGPEVVNAQLVGSVLVLDHLISHQAELRLGHSAHAEKVCITRDTPRTISCPGDQECPLWPGNGLAAAR
jgi:type IV secretion system protein TrbG